MISPLLANLYINRFLKHWRQTERTRAFRAHVVSYADDPGSRWRANLAGAGPVILSRGRADEALAWTRGVMAQLGLTINEAKTSVKNARVERFDFLGTTFGPHWRRRDGKEYPGASPSKKSIGRLRDKVSDRLVPGNPGPFFSRVGLEVRNQLNAKLRGWSGYFGYGSRLAAYRAIDRHVAERVRGFLTRRHKVAGRGAAEFPDNTIFGDLGVVRLLQSGNKNQPRALQ